MSLLVNRMDDFARRSLMLFLQKVDRVFNRASLHYHHLLLFCWICGSLPLTTPDYYFGSVLIFCPVSFHFVQAHSSHVPEGLSKWINGKYHIKSEDDVASLRQIFMISIAPSLQHQQLHLRVNWRVRLRQTMTFIRKQTVGLETFEIKAAAFPKGQHVRAFSETVSMEYSILEKNLA